MYGLKNSTLSYKILNISVLITFLVEGIGLEGSLGVANTPFCYVSPPSAYNGFRTAIVFSLIGSILIIIYLVFVVFHKVKITIQYNQISQRNSQDNEIKVDFLREPHLVLRFISICFLFYHISFFFQNIFGTVGCNGIAEFYIIPIGIFWLIPGILNVLYQIILKLTQKKKKIKKLFKTKFQKSP
jgi:hypothetical protein